MSAGPGPWIGFVLVLCAGLATAIVSLAARVWGLERRVAATHGDPDVSERVGAMERDLGAVTRRFEPLVVRLDRLDEHAQRSLQRVGVVRYDAFNQLGGNLSFSLALLDARRDGVVLSVLNDREGARAYAKPVTGGRSTFTLSEEEQRAITQA